MYSINTNCITVPSFEMISQTTLYDCQVAKQNASTFFYCIAETSKIMLSLKTSRANLEEEVTELVSKEKPVTNQQFNIKNANYETGWTNWLDIKYEAPPPGLRDPQCWSKKWKHNIWVGYPAKIDFTMVRKCP